MIQRRKMAARTPNKLTCDAYVVGQGTGGAIPCEDCVNMKSRIVRSVCLRGQVKWVKACQAGFFLPLKFSRPAEPQKLQCGLPLLGSRS